MNHSYKKRIKKIEAKVERKKDTSLDWPIFENQLAIINALKRNDEKFLKKFHPTIVDVFRKT